MSCLPCEKWQNIYRVFKTAKLNYGNSFYQLSCIGIYALWYNLLTLSTHFMVMIHMDDSKFTITSYALRLASFY